MKLVFMLEEPSMKEVLNVLLPKLLPAEIAFHCIAHSGKSDLEKSLPRKLRGWKDPDVRFFVLRDQDDLDCKVVKAQLRKICDDAGRPDAIIRIVCHELESWFLADLAAVELATGITNLAKKQNSATYRAPDSKSKPSILMKQLVPGYQKVSGARAIAPHLDLGNARSPSFSALVGAISKICKN